MDIQLKKIKVYESMSEETTAFTADVHINGKKVAYAKNDGQGGETFYHAYPDADHSLLDAAERHIQGLPNKKHEFQGKVYEIEQSLETMIDDLVLGHIQKNLNTKWEKTLEKNMSKGICFGTLDKYEIISWKGFTLPELLLMPRGRGIVRAKLFELKGKGVKILNTNIPEELFA